MEENMLSSVDIFFLIILLLLFFIFSNFVLALENLFFSLFSLILVYILASILCVHLEFLFHAFLILLLYVGALAVLFLFLIMLFDYRDIFVQKFNMNFLIFWLGFAFFFGRTLFASNYNDIIFKEDNLLKAKQLGESSIEFELFLQFIFNNDRPIVIQQLEHLNFLHFTERYSQIERLGAFMYLGDLENCNMILIIGVLLTFTIIIIYHLLEKK